MGRKHHSRLAAHLPAASLRQRFQLADSLVLGSGQPGALLRRVRAGALDGGGPNPVEAVQPSLHDTGGDPSSLYHDHRYFLLACRRILNGFHLF